MSWARSKFEQWFSGDIFTMKSCVELLVTSATTTTRSTPPSPPPSQSQSQPGKAQKGGNSDGDDTISLDGIRTKLSDALSSLSLTAEDAHRIGVALMPYHTPSSSTTTTSSLSLPSVSIAQNTPTAAVAWAIQVPHPITSHDTLSLHLLMTSTQTISSLHLVSLPRYHTLSRQLVTTLLSNPYLFPPLSFPIHSHSPLSPPHSLTDLR